MIVQNTDIVNIFNKLAGLLEIQGANFYRVRAYRTAAENIDGYGESVAAMLERGYDLSELPGIGEDLAGKIAEIIETGSLSDLEEIETRVPEELTELLELEGLGPKKVATVHDKLKISTLDELEDAARSGSLRQLPGFGPKLEKNVLAALARSKGTETERFLLPEIEGVLEPLLERLGRVRGVKRASVAGSYRRGVESVGDLDIVLTARRDANVMERFIEYEEVDRVVAQGKTRASVALQSGLQVDLRVVPEVAYGAAMCYFTGSRAHAVALRGIAQAKGLKINEYGVFRGNRRLAGRTEEEVYQQVGLPYIEPELRENRGEIEAAQRGELPDLLEMHDVRGDLRVHVDCSDRGSDLESTAQAAQEKGYEYLAVTCNTSDPDRLLQHLSDVDRVSENLEGPVLLKAAEVDILEDGSLALAPEILAGLDLVVCSVNDGFGLPQDEQTDRIVRAIGQSPCFTILGHPTGRVINEREPYALDLPRLFRAAKDSGWALELDARPDRLDLADIHCKMAKEAGVMVSIGTSAENGAELDRMRLGVSQARRGWLEAKDVLNTYGAGELRRLLNNKAGVGSG